MFRLVFVLAALLVGVTVSATAVHAREPSGSSEREDKRQAPAVPPASEVERDAAEAADEIERRNQTDHFMRDLLHSPSGLSMAG